MSTVTLTTDELRQIRFTLTAAAAVAAAFLDSTNPDTAAVGKHHLKPMEQLAALADLLCLSAGDHITITK